MPRWLYSLLLHGALPLVALQFKWRGWRHAAYRGSLGEHLGHARQVRADRPLWLHAASVGELEALRALHAAIDDWRGAIVVTVGTPSGQARARALFAADPRVTVQAAPWDLPGAVRRFLDATRPVAAVFVETELWPNLLAGARARAVPLLLVSARLSARSLQRYRRWAPGLMRETVRAFAAIGAQSEADRTRFIALGAAAGDVSVIGNLKFDLAPDAGQRERGTALRARWASGRALWVAGSTHAGEEAVLLAAQRQLLAEARQHDQPPPLLAIAPRRPERFDPVAGWLASQRLAYARASAAGSGSTPAAAPGTGACDVLLIDQLGSLRDWYAAADVAFVGGSLVPVGGHNLLEAAVLGKPVLSGPHTSSAPDVARCLIEAGGAKCVRNAAELKAALAGWLGDAAAAHAAGAKAAAAVAAHRGAAACARALLTALAVPSAPSASG